MSDVYLLVCSVFVFKPDHICRRQMYLLCRILACFGGNGGGDRRGVFAVGVPVKGVVLGMQCYGCHCFFTVFGRKRVTSELCLFIFACECECKVVSPQKNTRPGFIKVKYPRLGRSIPLPTLPADTRTETKPKFSSVCLT
jgi:hypothetical protein